MTIENHVNIAVLFTALFYYVRCFVSCLYDQNFLNFVYIWLHTIQHYIF